MKCPVIALSAVSLLILTGCAPTMTTAQSCSEYTSQLKTLIDQVPDTVKDDMHAIYLLESKSPDAKTNPDAAKRIEIACTAAK